MKNKKKIKKKSLVFVMLIAKNLYILNLQLND